MPAPAASPSDALAPAPAPWFANGYGERRRLSQARAGLALHRLGRVEESVPVPKSAMATISDPGYDPHLVGGEREAVRAALRARAPRQRRTRRKVAV